MIELLFAAEVLHGCVVEKVHDGDTLTVFCPRVGKVRVRLYCIDAPELAQEPWGTLARDHLKALVGRQVSLRPVVRDPYGRTVAVVFNRRYSNLNFKMVEDGWVAVYRRYCREEEYYQAQEEARRYRRGLWKVAGLHQRPWEYRRRQRQRKKEGFWETLMEWLERLFR